MAVKERVIKVITQFKRDTLERWILNNPVLRPGEMSYVTDLGKCKVGDGYTHWVDLPYFMLDTDVTSANIVVRTKTEWEIHGQLRSQRGTIYVYEEDDPSLHEPPLLKVGDGLAYICDLPFITDILSDELDAHTQDTQIHISQEEREFWNDKISCDINAEQLVLSKD